MKEPKKLFDFIFKTGIYSKFTLYVLLIVFVSDLLQLFMTNNIKYVVLYFLVGFVVSLYSKNFVVIFFISIVAINIVKIAEFNDDFHKYTLTLKNRHFEGIENNTNANSNVEDEDKNNKVNESDDNNFANDEKKKNNDNTIQTISLNENQNVENETVEQNNSESVENIPIPIVATSTAENFTTIGGVNQLQKKDKQHIKMDIAKNKPKIILQKINKKNVGIKNNKNDKQKENFETFEFVPNFAINAGKYIDAKFNNFAKLLST